MPTGKVDCVFGGFKLAADGVYNIFRSRTWPRKQFTISPCIALDPLPVPLFDVVKNVALDAAESIGVESVVPSQIKVCNCVTESFNTGRKQFIVRRAGKCGRNF